MARYSGFHSIWRSVEFAIALATSASIAQTLHAQSVPAAERAQKQGQPVEIDQIDPQLNVMQSGFQLLPRISNYATTQASTGLNKTAGTPQLQNPEFRAKPTSFRVSQQVSPNFGHFEAPDRTSPAFSEPVTNTPAFQTVDEELKAITLTDATAQSFFRLNDISIAARAAPYYDTARMNPLALGNFLASAIPVEGDPFYGKSGRASVQGTGSSLGATWLANPLGQPVSGAVRIEAVNADSSTIGASSSMMGAGGDVALTQGYVQWDNMIFGLTNTAFEDQETLCDTVDILGPIGRPNIKSSQPQVGLMFLHPDNSTTNPTGFYSTVSLEGSSPDIDLSVLNAEPSFKVKMFEPFSVYPDLIWFLRYADYATVMDPTTSKAVPVEEWHVQLGSVFRDLAIEQATTPESNKFGWGVQLSGIYAINTDPICGLRDYLYVTATEGAGIGHYFNDLHVVSPINDAVTNSSGTQLFVIPLMAYYVGYTHEWTQTWRTTTSFSHIELDNPVAGSTLTYHEGESVTVNLIYSMLEVTPAKTITYTDPNNPSKPSTATLTQASQHHLLAGVEASWGRRDNFVGDHGSDNRIMFVVAATK